MISKPCQEPNITDIKQKIATGLMIIGVETNQNGGAGCTSTGSAVLSAVNASQGF